VSNHKPATPLPWKAGTSHTGAILQANGERIATFRFEYDAEAAAHCVSAYPKLVAELRKVSAGNRAAKTVTEATGVLDDLGMQADALLRELGEAS
jgi:hypothetical protein